MSEHTPERLVLTSQDDMPTGCANFESRYGVDAIVLYHDNAKADARRIVQCWNSHDDLLEALQEVLRHFGKPMRGEWLNDEAFRAACAAEDAARAAIAKALGEQQ